MAVMMPREAWTDERLDDLNDRVGSLERRIDEGFKEMREEFGAVRTEMREMRAEVGALNRTVAQLAFGLVGAILIGFLATIAALVTLV